MTEDLMPEAVLEKLKPEYVSPGVMFMVSEDAPSGVILTAGGGSFAVAAMYETEGVHLGEGGLSAEEVRDNWAKISDTTGQQALRAAGEQTGKFVKMAMEG